MTGVEREATRARGAAPGFKVAILGAAGGIGQPLSLLMKMSPLVSTLHLYDVFNTPGVVADLSHTNTSAVVPSLSRHLISHVRIRSAVSVIFAKFQLCFLPLSCTYFP